MVDSMRLYGQAMIDHLHGRMGRLVIERDDGRREVTDISSLFAPYSGTHERWREDERKAIHLARGHVLDIGCGPGRVALYLQRRGIRVTAIDISPEALQVAKTRGVRNAMLMDARHLSFPPRSFDTFVMFGNNFGICGDFAATRRFLKGLAGVARPRARLIASTRTPGSWIPRHAPYVMKNVREGRPPGLIKLRLQYRGKKGSWFPLLLLSPDDAMRLCLSAGWEVVGVVPCGAGIEDYSFVAEMLD
jgi:SAM-dependent methyltransferase